MPSPLPESPDPTLRLLISFAYARSIDLPRVLDAAAGIRVELFADSGAFTVAHSGGRVLLKDYAAWLHRLGPLVRTAANLDVIGDPRASASNLKDLQVEGVAALPVFHMGSPWPVLKDLCADHDYVALGNMPGAARDFPLAMRNLVQCFKIAREYGVVFHGFGLTHGGVLAKLPFYSADSSTWTQGTRYARISLFDHRKADLHSLGFGGRDPLESFQRLIRTHGGDPAVLAAPGCALRARRDAQTFQDEKSMVYRVNIMAMVFMGQWLQQRHRVKPPPGGGAYGTCVYLAGTTTREVLLLVDAMRWLRDSSAVKD